MLYERKDRKDVPHDCCVNISGVVERIYKDGRGLHPALHHPKKLCLCHILFQC